MSKISLVWFIYGCISSSSSARWSDRVLKFIRIKLFLGCGIASNAENKLIKIPWPLHIILLLIIRNWNICFVYQFYNPIRHHGWKWIVKSQLKMQHKKWWNTRLVLIFSFCLIYPQKQRFVQHKFQTLLHSNYLHESTKFLKF